MLHHMNRASLASSTKDQYFDYVTLLLHGDGTNGGQNNTFVDSSANNFTVTRNGNTTQGSLSPYGNLWSNYFDGNVDSLTIADNAAFELGSGDFTVESWIYLTSYSQSYSGNYGAMIVGKDSTTSRGFHFSLPGTASSWPQVAATLFSSNSTSTVTSANYSFQLNTWYHLAFVRSGTSLRIYVNGVDIGGGTNSINIQNSTSSVGVGQITYTGFEYYFPGYISNLRIVKGSAVYTGNFTPSTTPLTAITNTSLLTCQSNRLIDASSNNFAITRNGDVSVQKFSPFAPTAEYSTTTNGGSGYFDNSGDYLTVADNAALEVAGGNFTMEMWVYPNSLPATSGIDILLMKGISSSSNLEFQFLFFNNAGTTRLRFNYSTDGINPQILDATSGNITVGQWYHIAITRSGSTITFWLNGVNVGSSTVTATFFTGTGTFSIAANPIGGNSVDGYVSDVRLVKGTAVYTTAFTPPSAPLTAITNTSLLVGFKNAGIIDNAAINDLETIGNAQISTAIKKFGTGSIAFDGTGDGLTIRGMPTNLQLGLGDFTIEGWVYFNTVSGNATISNTDLGSSTNLSYGIFRSGTTLQYFLSSNGTSWDIASGVTIGTVAASTWYHFALVRKGSTFTPYLDGIASTTTSSSASLFNTTALGIGNIASGSGSSVLDGYIDEVRVTKGIARYTANFTPLNAPFPNM